MILRLKRFITHGHDTKLLEADGEGTVAGWGTRPSAKAKPLKDLRDALTRGKGNRPNPGEDPTLAYGRRNRPNSKNESHLRRCGRQSELGKAYTHPAVDEVRLEAAKT